MIKLLWGVQVNYKESLEQTIIHQWVNLRTDYESWLFLQLTWWKNFKGRNLEAPIHLQAT